LLLAACCGDLIAVWMARVDAQVAQAGSRFGAAAGWRKVRSHLVVSLIIH
jgi:hypothetical protein